MRSERDVSIGCLSIVLIFICIYVAMDWRRMRTTPIEVIANALNIEAIARSDPNIFVSQSASGCSNSCRVHKKRFPSGLVFRLIIVRILDGC